MTAVTTNLIVENQACICSNQALMHIPPAVGTEESCGIYIYIARPTMNAFGTGLLCGLSSTGYLLTEQED